MRRHCIVCTRVWNYDFVENCSTLKSCCFCILVVFLFFVEGHNSRAEPQETFEMSTYNVFCWFSNLLTRLNKNQYHAQSKSLGKIFQGTFYISSSYASFMEKNVKFYYCHSIEWCILVERMRETETKCNISCICRTHLSREIRHSSVQNTDCACGVLFFCCLPSTVPRLLLDFIKQAAAHFAPFLAPFLLVLTILCFQDAKIC